ncbi:cbb3-type cytochrome c oxidase subunit I [Maribacter sp. R77961]|uniref:cbb3-type cytochrome c oxidase subunit I n=1 Tax=Maribacter sp. R77961 TaxID=3093871 RepID=UPI0037C5E6F8
MKKIIQKPHYIFFGAIAIVLTIGVFRKEQTLDINIEDTYFVIGCFHIALLSSISCGLIGLGYWLLFKVNKRLSKWLSLLHIILTFGGLFTLFVIPYDTFTENESAFPLYHNHNRLNMIKILAISAIVFGQMIYLINLFTSIIRKR